MKKLCMGFLVVIIAAFTSSCSKRSQAEIPTHLSGETRMGTTTGNDTLSDSQFGQQQRVKDKEVRNPASNVSPTPSDQNHLSTWPYAH